MLASFVPYFRDSGQLVSNWAQTMMLCASVREMRKLSPPAAYGYETQLPYGLYEPCDTWARAYISSPSSIAPEGEAGPQRTARTPPLAECCRSSTTTHKDTTALP